MTNPQTALMAAMQAGSWSNKEILDTAEVFLEWLNIEDEKIKPKAVKLGVNRLIDTEAVF